MLVMQLAPLRPLGAVAVCVSTVNAAVLGARPVLTGSLRCDEPGASLWPSPGWFPFLSPETCVGPGIGRGQPAVRHTGSSCSCSRLSGHLRFCQHIGRWVPPLPCCDASPGVLPESRRGPAGQTTASPGSRVSALLGMTGGALSGRSPRASQTA